MNTTDHLPEVVTVTLNPAIDRTVTIPHFTAGTVNRVEHVRSNPGGKGVNVAASLADYGMPVAVTGFLGRENTASFEAMFQAKHIADHFVRIAGQTRVGIKIVDPELHQTTDINFPGPAASGADQEELQRKLAALECGCFVLSGSLPPGVDAGIYGALIRTLKARGAKVILDTSGEPLRAALEAKPSLIKPNIDELEALLGIALPDETSVIQAARQLIAGGVETVVVSMGKAGACLVTSGEAVIARPPDVEVQSTVGAGDAMVAGIVAAQFQNLGLADGARLATAFSVHALTRGSNMSDSRSAIEALTKRVTLG
jgi:1-phosphofructokinase